jgi:hypothetical protein
MSYNTMATRAQSYLVNVADWTEIADNFAACLPFTVAAVFDGGGGVIATNSFLDIPVDFRCKITACEVLAQTGYASDASIQIDAWADHSTDFPCTSDDFITGSAKLICSTATGERAVINIATWTPTTFDAGQIIRLAVETCALITKATVKFSMARSS